MCWIPPSALLDLHCIGGGFLGWNSKVEIIATIGIARSTHAILTQIVNRIEYRQLAIIRFQFITEQYSFMHRKNTTVPATIVSNETIANVQKVMVGVGVCINFNGYNTSVKNVTIVEMTATTIEKAIHR